MSLRRRLAFLVITTALAAAAGATTAHADPVRIPDNTLFIGTGSDGGSATLRAPTYTFLDFSYEFGATAPAGCQTSFAFRAPLGPDGMSFGTANLTATQLVNVHVAGVVDPAQARAIVGLTMADGVGYVECGRHRATWIAARQGLVTSAPVASRPDSAYTGTATVLGRSVTGTVELTTDSSGALRSVSFDITQGACVYRASSGVLAQPIAFDGPAVQYLGTGWSMAAVAHPDGANGVAVLAGASPDCADIPVTFRTTAPVVRTTSPTPGPSASPAPTPTPAGASGASRPGFTLTPAAGWTTLSVVFAGGSPSDLEAAARDAGAAGVWLQDGSGTFQLLVVGAPPFLRESFERAFPSGVAGPVAVTLTR